MKLRYFSDLHSEFVEKNELIPSFAPRLVRCGAPNPKQQYIMYDLWAPRRTRRGAKLGIMPYIKNIMKDYNG